MAIIFKLYLKFQIHTTFGELGSEPDHVSDIIGYFLCCCHTGGLAAPVTWGSCVWDCRPLSCGSPAGETFPGVLLVTRVSSQVSRISDLVSVSSGKRAQDVNLS